MKDKVEELYDSWMKREWTTIDPDTREPRFTFWGLFRQKKMQKELHDVFLSEAKKRLDE